MSQLQQAVAFVFKRKGAREMPALEFKHAVSLDLRWFAPADALRFVDACLKRGFLKQEGDTYHVTFDPRTVEVPLRLKPDLHVIDEQGPVFVPPPEAAPAPPANDLLTDVARALEMERGLLDVSARQEGERAAGLLSPSVALLVAARRRGLDVRPYLER